MKKYYIVHLFISNINRLSMISVIDYLNSLNVNVKEINLSNKELTVLPDLSRFTNLKKLDCSFNKIKKINNLPEGLENLYCENNQIKELNNFPKGLKVLVCHNNKIKKLDNLPEGFEGLGCSYNEIQELNNLPNKLGILNCENNQIKELNNIPKSLFVLCCTNNLLPSVNINILKEIDINRKRETVIMFILNMSKSKNRFDNDDIFRKIGEYVLT